MANTSCIKAIFAAVVGSGIVLMFCVRGYAVCDMCPMRQERSTYDDKHAPRAEYSHRCRDILPMYHWPQRATAARMQTPHPL